ncbi:PAS domain S-box protein [Effusibacillus dendaii]|uniref:PAS domain-containing protein n=1 Tax=Effusibacillus dendaii TaxID=2743772 RepID=A0A7I8D5W0_9BACL|nr:PAS domain S-box protein [Effusibacillus dendaii]BCJ85538.1 hypothetical protein skT53_05230 [Effusibacillus dendaii]
MNNIDNKLYGAVGILQDLSHFEPIIKELDTYKKLAHQLDAIFESCQDGLYLTDGDGYTLRVNTAYEKMIGFKREDLIGKHISWLEEKGLISESVTLQVLTSKTAVSRIQKLANQKEILVTGTPVKNEEENISLVVHHARDITYLKALEAEVEKARESNETFSRGISQFRFGSPVEAEFPLQSEAMKEIVRRIRRISLFPTFVLLQGETGVGKEVIASMIHHYSPRAKKTVH